MELYTATAICRCLGGLGKYINKNENNNCDTNSKSGRLFSQNLTVDL